LIAAPETIECNFKVGTLYCDTEDKNSRTK
jgi:hypothetical protein